MAHGGGKQSHAEENHLFDKTRLCKFHTKGRCKRGQACSFAHGDEELQPQPDFYRTQLCSDYIRSGGCRQGASCNYAHGASELRRAQHRSSKLRANRPPSDRVQRVITESRRLETMESEVLRLHAELKALQALAGVSAAVVATTAAAAHSQHGHQSPTGVAFAAPALADQATPTSDGGESGHKLSGSAVSFSRQSTGDDGEAPASLAAVSRQASESGEAEEAWESSSSDLRSEMEDDAGEGAYKLTVKRTFINVEPLSAELERHRRAHSLPAHAQAATKSSDCRDRSRFVSL